MQRTFVKIFLGITGLLAIVLSWITVEFIFKITIDDLVKKLFDGEFKEPLIFFVLGLIYFAIINYGFYRLAKKFKWIGKGEKLGSSDFAKLDEFKDFTGDDGLIIGKNFRLNEKKCFEHVVCVGPTGSGKSASFFIPNLVSLPNASIVVSDPKGELFQKTAATNLAQGKRILVFSPFKEQSMKYNPLSLCRNVSEVRELTQILLANGNAAMEAMTGSKGGGSEWLNMAAPLLASTLCFVKNLPEPKNTVGYALNLIIENDIETLKFLLMDIDEESSWEVAAQKQFNIFMQSAESEKTASSIKTVLATNLQMFTDPMIETVTSGNEINPMMLRRKPTVLYVVVPEHKSDMMAPLMAPFYSQIMGRLVENGDGCPVFFLMDEFANIGRLPNLGKALSTVRSRKMSFALGIQSLNQIKQVYGQEESVSILENLKTKFAFPGLGFESAKYMSDLIGSKEISTTSTSFGKDNLSHSVSKQKRELLTPDEIRRIPDEHLVAVVDNRNPIMTQQMRYYKDQKMLKLTQEEMDIDDYVVRLREALNKSKQKKNG